MAHTHYSAFTVQNGQVPSTQTDFPVLLKPTDNRFRTTANGGNVANANGYDLRPYSDSSLTTALTYELVAGTYSATTGTFEMWVKVPSLSDGYIIYLGYGDTGLTTDGSSTSTWTSVYKLVVHFPDGSSLSVADSSQSNNDGTNTNSTATTGKIDGGIAFNGSNTTVDFNSVSMTGGEYTISFWAQRDTGTDPFIFDMNDGGGNRLVISLDIGNWGSTANAITYYDGTAGHDLGTANSIPDAQSLIHVTFSDSGTIARGYVNGSQTGTYGSYANIPFSTAITFGGRTTHVLNFSNNVADEFRMIQAVRSANWCLTEYNNQNAPGSFYSIGTEEAFGGAPRRWILGRP